MVAAFSTTSKRTESCSSSPSSRATGMISCSSNSVPICDTAFPKSPRLDAAALRTMGVSSLDKSRKSFKQVARRVSCSAGRRRKTAAKSAHAEIREVNQSPAASLCTRGAKAETCSSPPTSDVPSATASETRLMDSTARSRTTVSSTADKVSRGSSSALANSGPPTWVTKSPSSSASASSTSSSSSMESVKNGSNSARVRSGPNAVAMIFNRRVELSRNCTSSFFNSSSNTAIG
mmetsp:Transcript_52869/g.129701  ORF Transcript_52869/g.129701 Transcript_52869/m.129701 type:complete len:234 (-) Transcript_52869:80-781(-)